MESVSRWFSGGERGAEGTPPPSSESEHPAHEKSLQEPETTPQEISRRTVSVAEKMASFRKALEFEEGAADRLKSIHSEHDLLLYLYDVLFFRFMQLKELGLLNEKSSAFLESLSDRFGRVLAGDPAAKGGSGTGREAKDANAPRQQVFKTGIVTENELQLEEQVKYLQSRVREQHAKLQIARKKLKMLASYQEMVLSLRARNGLLTAKLDHQSRLLHSLVADNPTHKDLIATVEHLRDQNNALRTDLEHQSEVLHRLRAILPEDEQQAVNEILTHNADLQADLQARDDQLAQMTRECGKQPELLCYIDSLADENARLKEALASQQLIEKYVSKVDREGGTCDFSPVVESLKAENHRLQLALTVRDDQISALTSDPVNRQLKEAFERLQTDYRQVQKENQLKEQLYQNEMQERKALLLQLRETTALTKENQRLRSEIETSRRLLDVLKKRDFEYQILRKRHSELMSRYDRTLGSLEKANQKLAKITAEYNLLIKEYENIFGNR